MKLLTSRSWPVSWNSMLIYPFFVCTDVLQRSLSLITFCFKSCKFIPYTEYEINISLVSPFQKLFPHLFIIPLCMHTSLFWKWKYLCFFSICACTDCTCMCMHESLHVYEWIVWFFKLKLKDEIKTLYKHFYFFHSSFCRILHCILHCMSVSSSFYIEVKASFHWLCFFIFCILSILLCSLKKAHNTNVLLLHMLFSFLITLLHDY